MTPWRAACVCVLAAVLLGCPFEQPVDSRMEMEFLPDGGVAVEVMTAFEREDRFPANQPVLDRLRQERRLVLDQRDAWSRRVALIEPEEESRTVTKRAGELRELAHRFVVADPARLRTFFSDTPLMVGYSGDEGHGEIGFYVAGGGYADARQAARLKAGLREWSASVARYTEAADRLYDYLSERPERAVDCLEKVLSISPRYDPAGEEPVSAGETAEGREARIVNAVSLAMSAVFDAFGLGGGEAYSLSELAGLVYDPFPAPLQIKTPGPILEAEGVERISERTARVPPRNLLRALVELDGRWISPDPLGAIARDLAAGREGPVDAGEFASRPRRSLVADPAAVLEAVESVLEPPAVIRVRWSLAEGEDPGAAR